MTHPDIRHPAMKRSAKITLLTLLGLFLLLATELAAAEQFIEDDDYIVHYNAFNSIVVQPDIAKTYGIMRSSKRGIINISVQRKMPDGSTKAVMSDLKGFTGQLGGSEIPLDFQIVEEGKAIYYLAQFLIDNGETLNFNIKVKPVPEHPGLKISFSQAFFED